MELISRADAIKDAESWVAVDEHERHLQKNVIEWLKEFPSAEHGTNLAEVGTDCISRQAAIDALHTWFRDGFDEDKWWNSTHVLAAIEGISPVRQEYKWETCFDCPLSHGCPKIKGCTNEQAIEYASQIPNDCPLSTQQKYEPVQSEPSEITDEQAILHLQSTGWMQNHDREIYESGLKERLADDSESYDSLIPYEYDEDTISRQAAIDATKKHYRAHDNDLLELIAFDIEQLPSVQPEIIRCRECKFASGDSRICMKFDHSPIGELDFCAWAERREVTT